LLVGATVITGGEREVTFAGTTAAEGGFSASLAIIESRSERLVVGSTRADAPAEMGADARVVFAAHFWIKTTASGFRTARTAALLRTAARTSPTLENCGSSRGGGD
jgi:hypothetical protein